MADNAAQIMNPGQEFVPTTIPDNVLAGLPEDFTLADLQGTFSQAEIDRLMQGDDPIIAPAPDAQPAPVQQAEVVAPVVVPAPAAAPVQPAAPVQQAVVPIPPRPDTAAANEAIATLETQIAAVSAKFDEGELTDGEFQQQQRDLLQRQAMIKAQADLQVQTYNDAMTNVRAAWTDKVSAYQASNPHLVAAEHFDGWDNALKQVTSNPMYRSIPMEKQIELAAQQYAVAYQTMTGKPLPGAAPQAAPVVLQEPGKLDGPRKDPRPDPVQTLANVTAVDTQSADGSKFGYIDALMGRGDAEGAERALAALSDVDREAYLYEA